MYLIQHRRVWQARHTIPIPLRPYLGGRSTFKRSTGEADFNRAEAVAAEFYARWRRDLNAAQAARLEGLSPEDFMTTASSSLPMLDDLDGAESFTPTLAAIRRREAERGQKKVFRALAGVQIDEHLDPWLASLHADQPKTRHMKETDARAFALLFKMSRDVTRAEVQKWVDAQIAGGAAVATVRRKLSNIRSLWGYLQSLSIIPDDENPLDRLRLPEVKAGKTAIDVLPFTTDEVVALAAAAREKGDVELADAIVIGAFTGGRLEEIVTLCAEHVVDDFNDLILPGTKTDAAARRLPIHPDLATLLRRLVAAAPEGFLFPALKENKFGDRSNGVGKRFGKLKTDAGFGRNKVFHSIRKTWASQLWSAEVHPDLIDQMIGHSHKARLSIAVYAKDPARETKLKAIKKLSFPGILGT